MKDKMRLLGLALILLIFSPAQAGHAQDASQAIVAIAPFHYSGSESVKDITSGVAMALWTDLSGIPGIGLINPATVGEFFKKETLDPFNLDEEKRKKVRQGLGADYLLTGSYLATGRQFRLDLQVQSLATGDIRFRDKVQGSEDLLLDLLSELSSRVASNLGGVSPVKGGTLELKTIPEGAQVFLDEDMAGSTPWIRKGITSGEHIVRIELPGFQKIEERLALQDRQRISKNWTLKRLNGGVRIWWKTKVDSEIRFGSEMILMQDGVRYCRNLPAGEYTLETRIPYIDESKWEGNKGWKTHKAVVNVEPEQVIDIIIDNSTIDPGVKVSRCEGCEAGWDFNVSFKWFEK